MIGVTPTPVKNHQLDLVWKKFVGSKIIIKKETRKNRNKIYLVSIVVLILIFGPNFANFEAESNFFFFFFFLQCINNLVSLLNEKFYCYDNISHVHYLVLPSQRNFSLPSCDTRLWYLSIKSHCVFLYISRLFYTYFISSFLKLKLKLEALISLFSLYGQKSWMNFSILSMH